MKSPVKSKDELVEQLKTQLDDLAVQSAQAIAKGTALLRNRVIIDTGLRKTFDMKESFSFRYEQFLQRTVFNDSGQLSIAARSIFSEIPLEYQVKEADLKISKRN